MSVMDLMQGAPPEAPPEENPMAALMGAAPGGADPYAAEAPPEEAMPEAPAAGDEGGDESSDYQTAIDSLTSALNRPTTDQQEMAAIQKCIAAIQDLLGKNEKMMDSALGTNPQLRKALAGGGGA